MPGEPLRFGILGAARIAPMALVRPARRVPGATVLAVPEVEAVYNPLPNALHAVWTIRALEARKHVLCEKPFAATVAEAEAMAAAAARAGRVLMEAFHYRYHPLFARMQAILAAGEIGAVRHLEA